MGDDGQAEIALKAAKRATYIARCYGVELTADELWGKTREDIVERLDAAYLDRHNQRLALDTDGLDNLLPQLSPAAVQRVLQHIEHSQTA